MTVTFRDDMTWGNWRAGLAEGKAVSQASRQADADLRTPRLEEIARQTWADTTRVQNQDAADTNRIEAYDEINDRIKAVTGTTDLLNPAREGDRPRPPGQFALPRVPYPADLGTPVDHWKAKINDLRQQYPDALDWDDILDRPERQALQKMKEVRDATTRLDERMGAIRGTDIPYLRNVPLAREIAAVGANLARAPISTLTQFGVGFSASMTSPIDAAANLLGFGAGTRAKSLLKAATANAVTNAAVQMPLSAAKMGDYQRAGLPFGWDVWLSEVEGAASAGFVIDAAFRAPVRAVRAYRGETGLGGVLLDAVPEVKVPPKPEGMAPISPETIAASERGDLAATRQILEATGAIDDPEIRGALNHVETVGRLDAAALERLRELGVPDAEGVRILDGLLNGRYVRPADVAADIGRMQSPMPPRIADADAARVVDTARASLDAVAPGLADMVSMAVEARAQSIEAPVRRAMEALNGKQPNPARIAETLAREVREVLDDPAEAERIGRMIRVASGAASSPEIARMVQADPGLKTSLDVNLGRHAEALALASMSDADLGRVLAGDVPPQVAAWIANHIPTARHAEALDVIAKARPADMAEVVRLLDETVDQSNAARENSLARTDGMSDPTGPELQRRVEMMKKDAADAVKAAQEPIRERDKLDSKVEGLKGEVAKLKEKIAEPASETIVDRYGGELDQLMRAAQARLDRIDPRLADAIDAAIDADAGLILQVLETAAKRIAAGEKPRKVASDFVADVRALADEVGVDGLSRAGGERMFSLTDSDASTYAKKRAEIHESETQLADANRRLNPDPDSARELHAYAMRSIVIRREQDVRRAVAHAVMLGRAIAPEGTRIDVRTEEVRSNTGRLVEAYYAKGDGAIVLASYAADPTARMGHEVVHALVDVDALSPAEVKLLADEAVSSGVFTPDMRQRYADDYKDRANIDLLLQEEAAAHLIDARLSGKAKGAENTIAGRLAQIIERLRNLIKGYGFRSREDVVAAVLNGDAARRAPEPAWMRETPEHMFALADRATGQSMRRDLDALGYYSQALEAARGLKQAKGTPEQMLAQIKSAGVKDAEIEATNLKVLLDGKTSVTRDEIVAHLEQNRVGLREVRYGDVLPEYTQFVRDMETKYGEDWWAELDDADSARRVELAGSSTDPKFNEYSLDPFNPSYRETVLHLPARGGPEFVLNTAGDWGNTGGTGDLMRNPHFDRQNVITGHFPEPNIVGHMMTSMVQHEGKPTFLVDQIQSDWGQRLRDDGVRDEAKIEELKATLSKIKSVKTIDQAKTFLADADELSVSDIEEMFGYANDNDYLTNVRRTGDRIQAEIMTAETAVFGNPLVNTTDQWVNTTLRRAIRQAAEADAEFIAIPTGDTVLSYNPGDMNGMVQFYGRTQGRQSFDIGPDLEPVAKGESRAPVEGIVPKNLRKLLEKLDKTSAKPIKVDQVETPTKGMAGQGFTLFPLTSEVKRKVVNEGQVMFAFAGERAKTADLEALSRAKEMETAGTDRTAIWTETGWFRGVDGKWKWEIDDSGAKRARLASASADGWASVGTYDPSISDQQIAMGIYNRLAGEVEARAVQNRLDMTPAERLARPPWMDYDVPESEQIVRFADGGRMFALGDTDDAPAPRPILETEYGAIDRMNQMQTLIEACRA